MSLQSVRQFLAQHAPDIEIIELDQSTATVDLAAKGKTVKPVAQRCEKITCSECGRRRFGITYEVTGRATRKKEVTKK